MVSILPSDRSGWDSLGREVGAGMQRAMPQMYENQKREMGLKAIDDLQNAFTPKPGEEFDQAKVLSQLSRAMALNPGMERSGIVDYVMKMANAKSQQGLPPPGGQQAKSGQQTQREPEVRQPWQKPEINFFNTPAQKSETFPNNIGPQGKTGNAPQAATKGEKVPVRTPNQLRKDAISRSEAATARGMPLSPGDAYKEEVAENEQAKIYNQGVEEERSERVASQKGYGSKASNALLNVYPSASPKMQAIAKKWGEDAANAGVSEAKIDEYLAEKAAEYGAKIDNVKRSMSRPDVINNIERGIDGTYKTFEQSAADVRKHLQPLLDDGLYDDARNLLTDLNYGPEEREIIINPLSQRVQTTLNSVPKVSKEGLFGPTEGYKKFKQREGPQPVANKESIKAALLDLKESDPNFSPLLARKYLEDRGYDWRLFKDAWNELLEGDQQNPEEFRVFKLTGDQQKMAGYLDTPPLENLQKILHGMDIIGR
jgi:hypothetical protein